MICCVREKLQTYTCATCKRLFEDVVVRVTIMGAVFHLCSWACWRLFVETL